MNFTMNLIFIINTIATHCFQDFLNNFWKTVVHPEIEPENKWENVIALRNSKYRNWLDFNNLHPEKSIIIRYEDINTEESATKIMETFVKKFNLQPGVVWIITKLMKKQKWTGFILKILALRAEMLWLRAAISAQFSSHHIANSYVLFW